MDRFVGPINWPPGWPHINPMDFYLWEHLTSLIYSAEVANTPATYRQFQKVRFQGTVNCFLSIPVDFYKQRN